MRILDKKEIAVFCPLCGVPDGDLAAALGLLEEQDVSVEVVGSKEGASAIVATAQAAKIFIQEVT